MSDLQVKKGTNALVNAITPKQGEPVWETDTQQFKMGDGVTVGGIPIGGSATMEVSVIDISTTDPLLVSTIEADLNATDFTGQLGLTTTFVPTFQGDTLIINYSGRKYIYIGVPKNIGVGGIATVASDFTLLTTAVNDLVDVNADKYTGIGDGYRLAWNNNTELWEPKISTSGIGVIQLDYRWDDTNDITPNSGRVSRSINSSVAGTPITLYFSQFGQSGIDLSLIMAEMTEGGWLNIYESGDSTSAHRFDIAGDGVHNGNIWEIPCFVFDTIGAGPSNNEQIQVYFRTESPDNKLPAGGTTGQHLTKIDGTNYNVEWTDAGSGSTFEVTVVDSGAHNVATDLNTTDFTGQGFPDTFLILLPSDTLVVDYNGDKHIYVGATQNIGLGGVVTSTLDFAHTDNLVANNIIAVGQIAMNAQGFALGSTVIITGFTTDGAAILGYAAADTPVAVQQCTNNTDQLVHDDDTVGAWVQICEITLAADVAVDTLVKGYWELLLNETGGHVGVFEIGFGVMGADPLVPDTRITIPQDVSQVYSGAETILSGGATTGDTVALFIRAQGDHNNFELLTGGTVYESKFTLQIGAVGSAASTAFSKLVDPDGFMSDAATYQAAGEALDTEDNMRITSGKPPLIIDRPEFDTWMFDVYTAKDKVMRPPVPPVSIYQLLSNMPNTNVTTAEIGSENGSGFVRIWGDVPSMATVSFGGSAPLPFTKQVDGSYLVSHIGAWGDVVFFVRSTAITKTIPLPQDGQTFKAFKLNIGDEPELIESHTDTGWYTGILDIQTGHGHNHSHTRVNIIEGRTRSIDKL